MLRRAGELLAERGVLGGDADWAGVLQSWLALCSKREGRKRVPLERILERGVEKTRENNNWRRKKRKKM
jgi:hypothetical protein